MDTAPRISSYEWAGGREAMLRWGSEDGPVVVVALPLFEEANRTRALGVTILRALAARGIGCVLPELPGQGESEVATERATLTFLRAAFAAVPGSHAAAIRSGAMLVDQRPAWMLAPQDGPTLLRELARVKGGPLTGDEASVAGNLLSRELRDELALAALPGEGRGPAATHWIEGSTSSASPQLGPGLRRGGGHPRVVRLTSDPRAADRHVEGSATWRRAEPSNDFALAQTLAADIANWIATCAA